MSTDDEYGGGPIPPAGEMSYTIHGDGSISGVEKHDERSKAYKGGAKTKALPDDAIVCIGTRHRSGIIDYRIGTKITVSYRGQKWGAERQYLCHTCIVNKCQHTDRVHRWREENE